MDVNGVKGMLDRLAKKRDGGEDEELAKPKGWFS